MDDRPAGTFDVAHLQRWQADRTVAWGRLLLTSILILMLGIVGRVVQLKVQPDPRMVEAVGSPFSSRSELARRGDLLDRKGRLIATTTVGYRLFIDPTVVEDPDTVALDVAALVGGDPAEIDRKMIARPGRRFVVLNDLLTGWQVDAVRRAGLDGLGLAPRLVRHYPYGERATALVGMVGFEHTGLSGMEHRYNGAMLPDPGRLTFLRDARRQALWIEPSGYRPPEDGAAVQLSIDLVIQEMVEIRLLAAVEERRAAGGRVVVLDTQSGEVLALHDVITPRPERGAVITDAGRAADPALGRLRCVTDPYEPGSTFKPFVWSVATALGRADPDEVLPTPALTPIRTSYGRRIEDSHYDADSTWREVLIRSQNSGMAIVSERMTHREMQGAVRGFGFGALTGCGLPGESKGIVTSAASWSNYTQSSVAMGHEIAVTPMQMVRAFSAFARDGTILVPRLTARRPDDPAAAFIRRVIPESIALETRAVMRELMHEGTGRRAQSDTYELFGKSGTAQLPKPEGGGYYDDRYVSSFIAGAPFERPRLVVLCVIDDPERSRGHWGSQVAGPVVRDVLDGALEYLGIAPDKVNADELLVAAE